MPLESGASKAAIQRNIRKLISEKFPPKQAVAIAYERAGKAKK